MISLLHQCSLLTQVLILRLHGIFLLQTTLLNCLYWFIKHLLSLHTIHRDRAVDKTEKLLHSGTLCCMFQRCQMRLQREFLNIFSLSFPCHYFATQYLDFCFYFLCFEIGSHCSRMTLNSLHSLGCYQTHYTPASGLQVCTAVPCLHYPDLLNYSGN